MRVTIFGICVIWIIFGSLLINEIDKLESSNKENIKLEERNGE